MSRNQNSHFSLAPHVNIPRSTFDMSHSVKLTCNASDLVPFTCVPVLPGDTFSVDTSILARMQTLAVPLMDNLYVDTYYFFVPNRLLWKHWQNFMGESDEPWYDETAYSVPMMKFRAVYDSDTVAYQKNTVAPKSVADYLGITTPNSTGTSNHQTEASHLPFRAYCKIWNDWFRNENIQELTTFNTEDTNVDMDNTKEAWYGGSLLKVNKYKDYFTSVLPEPQKGPEVTIGVANTAPVFTTSSDHSLDTMKHGAQNATALHWQETDGSIIGSTNNTNFAMYAHVSNGSSSTIMPTYANTTSTTVSNNTTLMPVNLWADLSAATGISINELRLAFATQKFYEQAARGGTRYIEILDSMFGVTNGDARLQRSEYLGGARVTVNVNQAVQQSETSTTPLGNIGAYSLTTDTQNSFTKSFTEHGYVIGVLAIRYDHSYSQGLPRHFSQKDKFDFYWPMFANIGEQPVLNKEIYLSGNATKDEEVFGYQEAWAFYRYANNTVAGEMRPNYAQTLDFWHLGDDYASRPSYSAEWIVEDASIVNRALAVSGNVADQFLIDMWIQNKATRPMPLFSVPGMHIV